MAVKYLYRAVKDRLTNFEPCKSSQIATSFPVLAAISRIFCTRILWPSAVPYEKGFLER